MTTRLAVAALLTVLSFGSVGVSSAATSPVLSVTASRTAETQLVVTRTTTLDPSRTIIAGGGHVAGWALTRTGSDTSLMAAELRLPRWSTAPGRLLRVGTSTTGPLTLAPASYRLVVFADEPVKVTILLRAGTSVTRKATSPTSASATLTDLLANAPVVAEQNVTTVRYPGQFLLSQTYFRAQAHQLDAVAQCFAPSSAQARACVGQQGTVFATPSAGSVGDGYTSTFAAAYGDDFQRGESVDVLLQAADADAPSLAEWLVVVA